MALERGTLAFPITVGAGTTVGIVTVSGTKKIYIKSIVIHNTNVGTGNTDLTQTVQVYMVPNDGGSSGTASQSNRIFRGSLEPDDTFTFEPNYPITLSSDGDTIQVYNEGLDNGGVATNPVNILILGDKEV